MAVAAVSGAFRGTVRQGEGRQHGPRGPPRGAFAVGLPLHRAGSWQLPGDGTQDGLLNLTDPIALLGHLFLGAADPLGCGDASPTEGASAALLDVNGDEAVNIADAVHVLNYLFLGGPAPVLGAECLRIPGCPDVCGP